MPSADFKRIVLTEMHSVLKPAGFHKNGQEFSIDVGDVVLFVQLQSSRKSTKDFVFLTVNLGIFSKALAALVGDTPKPNIFEAQWRQRIGRYLFLPRDKWWEIRSEPEAHSAGKEIAAILSNKVLADMKLLASTDALRNLWETGVSPGLTEYQRQRYVSALRSLSLGS